MAPGKHGDAFIERLYGHGRTVTDFLWRAALMWFVRDQRMGRLALAAREHKKA
ncbi:hypothetical protein [Trinickia mobilis]|uniref:hypothetical protein n=1 Tax=Trinickia mobilis TaxID=2816356 RepID=UPI001A8EA924|nr:hypothetical protein [Trinickia mobilis]